MNNKTIVSIVVIIVAVLAGYWVLSTQVADGPAESENRQVQGEIVSIDSSKVPVDGPYYIDIDFKNTEGPREGTTIVVPSMGINLCAARENMADIGTLSVGMIIEANGYTGEGGYVMPCESETHFLRVVSDEVVGADVDNEDGDSGSEGDSGIDNEEGRTACTQEAKLCPDGSYVGRTGPNCEFAACPGE